LKKRLIISPIMQPPNKELHFWDYVWRLWLCTWCCFTIV